MRETPPDTDTFEILYHKYRTSIYRYVHLRVYNEEDALDLTQQIFLQALRAWPAYQERGLPTSAWLFKIARNSIIDYIRKSHKVITWEALPQLLSSNQLNAPNPEEQVLLYERLNRLRLLLADLNYEKKELLALRFAAGLSSSEISLIVDKSEAAVKKQLGRILTRLKEQYHYMEQQEDA